MKNKLWLIAIVAVIGFSFAACGGNGGDNDGNGTQTDNSGKAPDGVKTPDGQTPDSGNVLGPNNEVPGDTLAAQLEWLKSNAQSDTAYTLTARADEALDNQLSYYGKSNITITLRSSGGEKILRSGTNIVGNGVTLILEENITLSRPELRVYEGGALVMNDGVKIIGGVNDTCVSVWAGGTFTMNGGTISCVEKAFTGVQLREGGGAAFIMNGGEILGFSIAGVLMGDNSTFTMNYGTISGSDTGRGVYIYGGDDNGAIFTMNGGTISDNTYEGTTSANNHGGGVYIYKATFIMNDGKISGNASNYLGGGVEINRGTFTMNGGEISGNTANCGGGVYLGNSTFTMNGGKISGNTAILGTSGGTGGGVSVQGSNIVGSSTFIMNGGEISGNTAGMCGGGVEAASSSSSEAIFRISNGIIYGSDATEADKANTIITTVSDTYVGISLYGIGQYGTGGTWTNIPYSAFNVVYNYRNTTINVINGALK